MEPYLSIVATSRNDDHGGNLIGRMQAFADNLSELSARYKAAIELVIVEWNPPGDKPKLAEVVKWPSNEYITTRILLVPNELHSRFEASERLPLFQMIGKNVGIRRSRADFHLATNVDVLFPERFFRMIAERSLSKHVMYRTDRFDVDRNVTSVEGVLAQLDYCKKNLVAVQGRRSTTVVDGKSRFSRFTDRAARLRSDSSHVAVRLLTVARLAARPGRNREHLDYHVPRLLREVGLPGPLPRLHTNACGDFQLMHKDDWNAIEGYSEFKGYSMHLDSCASIAAFRANITEKILPFAVYHIDHTGGWSIQSEKDGSFDKMVESRGLKYVDIDDLEEKLIHPSREPIYTNGENWGLRDVEIAEEVIE
jgi:hypothetical protein